MPLRRGELLLEPVATAHAEAMYATLRDPALHRYTDQPAPASVDALRERYARWVQGAPAGSGQRWLNWIVVGDGGGPVGTVQATVFDGDRSAWIAYLIARSSQGRGHATIAVQAMLEHLAACRVERFLARVEIENAASIRLLERLGFAPADESEAARHAPTPTERVYVRDARPRSRQE